MRTDKKTRNFCLAYWNHFSLLLAVWLIATLPSSPLVESVRADLSKARSNEIKGSVALIRAAGSHGSGLIVNYPRGNKDSYYIITNAHVIRDGNSISHPSEIEVFVHPKWLKNDKGKEKPVKSIPLFHEEWDLALLEVDKKDFSNVPTTWTIKSDADLRSGRAVTHYGFPHNVTHGTSLTEEELLAEGVGKVELARIQAGIALSRGQILDVAEVRKTTNVFDSIYKAADGQAYETYRADRHFYFGPSGNFGGSGGGVFDDDANWIGILRGGDNFKSGPLVKQACGAAINPKTIATFLSYAPQQYSRISPNSQPNPAPSGATPPTPVTPHQSQRLPKSTSAPILVIDRSGSIKDDAGVMNQVMHRAREVVQEVLKIDGNAAVVNFSGPGNSALDANFTNHAGILYNAISRPSINGGRDGTALYDAVVRAVNDARARGKEGRIILFTDGKDHQSKKSIADVVRYCNEHNVVVVVVGFVGTEGRDDVGLFDLASGAHGFYVKSENMNIKQILDRARTHYQNVQGARPFGSYD